MNVQDFRPERRAYPTPDARPAVTVTYSPAYAGQLLAQAYQASRDACPADGLVAARKLTRKEAANELRPCDHAEYRRRLTAQAWTVQPMWARGLTVQV
jgi:hypothetical protein